MGLSSTDQRDADAAALRRSPPQRAGGRTADVTGRLFRATMDILEEGGLAAVSFAAVADRAGVNRSTVYRRWPSPAALILEAAVQRLRENIVVADTGTLRGDLRARLLSLGAFLDTSVGRAGYSAVIQMGRDPEFAQQLRGIVQGGLAPNRLLFERAIQSGELAADVDIEALSSAASGAIYVRGFLGGEPVDEAWVDRVLNTLIPPPHG